MSEASAKPFPPEVVQAVMAHMNDDHGEDSLRICRALGDQPEATSAVMTGMDSTGIDFSVETPAGPAPVRVPWGEEVTERAQVRMAVVRLHDQACTRLGLPVPDREGH